MTEHIEHVYSRVEMLGKTVVYKYVIYKDTVELYKNYEDTPVWVNELLLPILEIRLEVLKAIELSANEHVISEDEYILRNVE
jgi:hypothetical protein